MKVHKTFKLVKVDFIGGVACAESESFVRGGPTLTIAFFLFCFVFVFVSGDMVIIQIPLEAGHHRSASEMPFKGVLLADAGLILNAGLAAL